MPCHVKFYLLQCVGLEDIQNSQDTIWQGHESHDNKEKYFLLWTTNSSFLYQHYETSIIYLIKREISTLYHSKISV